MKMYLLILIMLASTVFALPSWIDPAQYVGYELAGYKDKLCVGEKYCGGFVFDEAVTEDPNTLAMVVTYEQIITGMTIVGNDYIWIPAEQGVFYILSTIVCVPDDADECLDHVEEKWAVVARVKYRKWKALLNFTRGCLD